MAYQLKRLPGNSGNSSESTFREQIDKLLGSDGARFRRLWGYYRNPMRACGVPNEEQGSERPCRQAQESGLPSRITGVRAGLEIFSGSPVEQVARKEVVIENDIGWRVDTIVDYLFGKPIVINSAAPDPARRAVIEQLLRQVIAHNGGIVFLQQLTLLGAVYGFIDVLVKFDAEGIESSAKPQATQTTNSTACGMGDLGQPPVTNDAPSPDGDPPSATENPPATDSPHVSAGPESSVGDAEFAGASSSSREAIECLARRIRLEIVEPARALPILSPDDYRCVCAYGQVYQVDRAKEMPAEAGT